MQLILFIQLIELWIWNIFEDLENEHFMVFELGIWRNYTV